MRAPANMPAAPQPIEPAGLGPSTQSGGMNFQSTINPLASSDVGGTAGHVAAACVSARGECDGESVRDARDANCILPPTTLSPLARQVVASHMGALLPVSGVCAVVLSLLIAASIYTVIVNGEWLHLYGIMYIKYQLCSSSVSQRVLT